MTFGGERLNAEKLEKRTEKDIRAGNEDISRQDVWTVRAVIPRHAAEQVYQLFQSRLELTGDERKLRDDENADKESNDEKNARDDERGDSTRVGPRRS